MDLSPPSTPTTSPTTSPTTGGDQQRHKNITTQQDNSDSPSHSGNRSPPSPPPPPPQQQQEAEEPLPHDGLTLLERSGTEGEEEEEHLRSHDQDRRPQEVQQQQQQQTVNHDEGDGQMQNTEETPTNQTEKNFGTTERTPTVDHCPQIRMSEKTTTDDNSRDEQHQHQSLSSSSSMKSTRPTTSHEDLRLYSNISEDALFNLLATSKIGTTEQREQCYCHEHASESSGTHIIHEHDDAENDNNVDNNNNNNNSDDDDTTPIIVIQNDEDDKQTTATIPPSRRQQQQRSSSTPSYVNCAHETMNQFLSAAPPHVQQQQPQQEQAQIVVNDNSNTISNNSMADTNLRPLSQQLPEPPSIPTPTPITRLKDTNEKTETITLLPPLINYGNNHISNINNIKYNNNNNSNSNYLNYNGNDNDRHSNYINRDGPILTTNISGPDSSSSGVDNRYLNINNSTNKDIISSRSMSTTAASSVASVASTLPILGGVAPAVIRSSSTSSKEGNDDDNDEKHAKKSRKRKHRYKCFQSRGNNFSPPPSTNKKSLYNDSLSVVSFGSTGGGGSGGGGAGGATGSTTTTTTTTTTSATSASGGEDWSNGDEHSSKCGHLCCCGIFGSQYSDKNLLTQGGTLNQKGKPSKSRKCAYWIRRCWSIRCVVLVVIAASILVLGLVVWLLHFVLSKNGEQDVLYQTQDTQMGRINDNIEAYLAVGPIVLQTVQKLFQLGEEFVPEIATGTIRTSILLNKIRYSTVAFIGIGYETGEFEGIEQLSSNDFLRGYQASASEPMAIERIDPNTLTSLGFVRNVTDVDVRLQPWYIHPIIDPMRVNGTERTNDQYVWSDALPGRAMPLSVGISVGMTFRDFATNRLKGVISVVYDLAELNEFLWASPVHNNTVIFIMNRKGEVIGSNVPPLVDTLPLPLASTHPSRILRELYAHVVHNYGPNTALFPLNSTFRYNDFNGNERAVSVQTLRRLLVIDWVIVVSVLSKDVASDVYRANRLSIIISVVIIFVVVVVALIIGWIITKPLQSIAESTTQVANMNFSDSKKSRVRTFHFYEFEVIVRAMNQMKKALRNFEKYVPTTVVKSLMDSHRGIRIGVEPMYITIMFLDIADFTSITEKTDPDILVSVLEEFFTSMSEVISDNQGIIDKYIGDCIMTLFNAPNTVPNHEEMAVKSALEMQRRTLALNEGWALKPHYPQFAIRIGINTAECLVGNVGSANRVNYTALGDGVHIASNLEALNKIFHTRIIIGEKTFDAIQSRYACSWLCRIKYKDKRLHTYTVFDEADVVTEDCMTSCLLHNMLREPFEEKNVPRMLQICNEILTMAPSDIPAQELKKKLEESSAEMATAGDWDIPL